MFNIFKKKKSEVGTVDFNIEPDIQPPIDDSPMRVGYPDADIQNSIYEFSSKYIAIESSILDLGAGFGDYYTYLRSVRQREFHYAGIEFLPDLVKRARVINNVELINASWDMMALPKMDWVVNILSLTLEPIGGKDFNHYVETHLMDMYNAANVGVSFTFLRPSNYTDLSDYKTIELNSLIKFCNANNFLYIIDCSYNDYVTNLIIFK